MHAAGWAKWHAMHAVVHVLGPPGSHASAAFLPRPSNPTQPWGHPWCSRASMSARGAMQHGLRCTAQALAPLCNLEARQKQCGVHVLALPHNGVPRRVQCSGRQPNVPACERGDGIIQAEASG